MATALDEMALFQVRGPSGRLSAVLQTVEAALHQLDIRDRFEPDAEVRSLELDAARSACVAMDRVLDDVAPQIERLAQELDFSVGEVIEMAQYPQEVRVEQVVRYGKPTEPPRFGLDDVERVLLEAAGLSSELARRHVETARASLNEPEIEVTQADQRSLEHYAVRRLEAGRWAVCEYAARLQDAETERQQSIRARARMRRVRRVLGGTLITATNTTAGLLLGPVGAAVSTVLGGAATGIVEILMDEAGESPSL